MCERERVRDERTVREREVNRETYRWIEGRIFEYQGRHRRKSRKTVRLREREEVR